MTRITNIKPQSRRSKTQQERIRYLEGMIKTAKVISDRSADDAVGLFDNVLVYMVEDDEEQTIKIVTTVR